MKFNLDWINKYTNITLTNKEVLNNIIDRIALQIVDVDERWFLENNAVIDIDNKIVTNRPYCFGHRGMAREISVMLNQEYKGNNYPTIPDKSADLPIKIVVKNPELCPRFMAISIKGIKIGPSPEWLRNALEAVGQRSINNIVDITNFVMLDTAQPVHAYDYDKIKDATIIVRSAEDGEKATTLDGVERNLKKNMLLITDPEKTIGIAGVMGGGNSEIDDNTTNVLLETASFQPQNIRQTSKYLKHRTDAATRFEKGVDPTNIPNVISLLACLIIEICGGNVASELVDVDNLELSKIRVKPLTMEFAPQRVNKLLGFNTDTNFIKQVFDGFEIKYDEISTEKWTLTIPTYRPDIKEPADLTEDIGRMYGYQNIPSITPINRLIAPINNKKVVIRKRIRKILTSSGLDEVITYPMISQKDVDTFHIENPIKVVNPLSEEYLYMRPTMIPSLTKTTSLNVKYLDEFGIFETAKKFIKRSNKVLPYEEDHGASMLPEEKDTLCLMYYKKSDKEKSIFKLKGAIENLMNELQISNYKFSTDGKISINNTLVGEINLLSKKTAEIYDIPFGVSYAEIELNEIYNNFTEVKTLKSYSKFQGSSLDYSVLLPLSTPVENVLRAIPNNNLIVSKEIIDVFKNLKDVKDKKSVSVRILLQNIDKNLTENEIYDVAIEIEKEINKIEGAEIRGGGVQMPKDYNMKIVEELKPLLAAEILSIEKHPNADRLVITQVSVGNEKYQIVTGASNMVVGDLVPVALPGTAVPGFKNEDGSLVVMKVAKLRGIESWGMMLAGDELGISNDHEGIFILDKEKFKVGDIVKPEELMK
ncbi:MAG: phenylalanine--tRNA ligase subunit beta [bacterium]